jgi:hypothetical protein
MAIAVSQGLLVNGKQVTIVTTNDTALDSALRGKNGFRRQPGEEMGLAPVAGEHAEDVAERTFGKLGVKRTKKVHMGTEPKACSALCAKNCDRHPWIVHERLPRK